MRTSDFRYLRVAGLLAFATLLAWVATPEPTSGSPASLQSAISATPAFFRLPAGALAFTPPLLMTPPPDGGEHATSVLPNSGNYCSAQASNYRTGNPAECSVAAGSAPGERQCSVTGDSGLSCSAYSNAAAREDARCSTFGGIGSQCSVLDAGVEDRYNRSSTCSAVGPNRPTITCSVLGSNGVREQQACSSSGSHGELGALNFCSAWAGSGGTTRDSRLQCSVLDTTATEGEGGKKFCSAFNTQHQKCSAFAPIAARYSPHPARCSVADVNVGACTAVNAPNGNCSVINGAGPAHCSVITDSSRQEEPAGGCLR